MTGAYDYQMVEAIKEIAKAVDRIGRAWEGSNMIKMAELKNKEQVTAWVKTDG